MSQDNNNDNENENEALGFGRQAIITIPRHGDLTLLNHENNMLRIVLPAIRNARSLTTVINRIEPIPIPLSPAMPAIPTDRRPFTFSLYPRSFPPSQPFPPVSRVIEPEFFYFNNPPSQSRSLRQQVGRILRRPNEPTIVINYTTPHPPSGGANLSRVNDYRNSRHQLQGRIARNTTNFDIETNADPNARFPGISADTTSANIMQFTTQTENRIREYMRINGTEVGEGNLTLGDVERFVRRRGNLTYGDTDNSVQVNPEFHFRNYRDLDFDIKNATWQDFFNIIRENRDSQFQFHVLDGNHMAYGIGATKQVYQKVFQNLVEDGIFSIDGYFMDINLKHVFWCDDDNLELLVIFIALMVKTGCLLTYHFHPTLLECIVNREMTIAEMEFFVEKIDTELVKNINKMDEQQLQDMGYDKGAISKIYREKLIQHLNNDLINLQKRFAKHFEMFDAFNKYNVIDIDKYFSGVYNITPQQIINITHVFDEEYREIWNNFVNSLCELELRQMLLYFGNSLSLNNNYTIHVSDTMSTDIHVTTCAGIITIHRNIIQNIKQLKIILCDGNTIHDTISDGHYTPRMAENNHPENNNQRENITRNDYSAINLQEIGIPRRLVMGALLDTIATNFNEPLSQPLFTPLDINDPQVQSLISQVENIDNLARQQTSHSDDGLTGIPQSGHSMIPDREVHQIPQGQTARNDNTVVGTVQMSGHPLNRRTRNTLTSDVRWPRPRHLPPRRFIDPSMAIRYDMPITTPESERVGIVRSCNLNGEIVSINRDPTLNRHSLSIASGIWNPGEINQAIARGIRATPNIMPLVRNPIIILDDESARKKKSKKSVPRKINRIINYSPGKNSHKKSYR